jgi:hypothetical protein
MIARRVDAAPLGGEFTDDRNALRSGEGHLG